MEMMRERNSKRKQNVDKILRYNNQSNVRKFEVDIQNVDNI